MAHADDLFIETCKKILDEGHMDLNAKVRPKWADDGSSAYTKKAFAVVNRYDLSKEFPALTLRPIPFKNCIDELLWIWQRCSNNVHDLHSHIWDAWADETGSIGKAYGYQLAKKYDWPEGRMTQVEKVRYDLKHNPQSRRILTSIYDFNDLNEMHLYPCAYSMTFNVVGNKLCGILHQRSNDVLVANNWNVVQYAILLHMLAIDANLEVGELVHVIADAHIYDRHIPIVDELIKRPTFKAPKLLIDPDVKSFDDFQVSSFQLEDYQHNPQIKGIPVAV
ncbi:thymidylate synthase [Amygdalobacter nucleatus]|uniref:Thymidylate synthase n=1 Tax=Amygdalobacter nucleatus TaxID=3029274 RepID=A0A133YHP7_9FIRM|nr:thymidylate synthase [Amygdalobacter nucleatus]KXB42690.1 thymidylate synthase [Amygdalobacter nucleatus]MDF0486245.1 thymidylate synthase [Amygdalobacter nucleatus]WEG37197.1 thymidylate synthase [Amygdalobacter nucleatus]